jgi:glycosyltransferase involved in cell wall biosynthesis
MQQGLHFTSSTFRANRQTEIESIMKTPLISIIVPAYNVESYISNALDSILAQTYTKIEIIVVNDGSKDRTRTIIDHYASIDNRIKAIHKENGGVTSARLRGVSEAAGEWIGFVD